MIRAIGECVISSSTVNDLTHDIYIGFFGRDNLIKEKKYANVTIGGASLHCEYFTLEVTVI